MTSKNHDIDYIFSPRAVRNQARAILEATAKDETHFNLHMDRMGDTIDYVLTVIRKNYPDLNIPFHSRWRHFDVGGADRTQWLKQRLGDVDALELARTKVDLAVTSVLLDAGAGVAWSFKEKETGKSYTRSEGLGVASFHLFFEGALSSDGNSLRADGICLEFLKSQKIAEVFQVTGQNPLVGVEGRTNLLRSLGAALRNSMFFKDGRPGNLVDYFKAKYGFGQGTVLPAPGILRAVLDGFGSIWPSRLNLEGTNLGDVWNHSRFGFVPFHKLSQWMTYSLIEPLVEAGFHVSEVEYLTGLAEYRNGGLMIDSGLITLKEAIASQNKEQPWAPDSDVVIEWRALTIALLDEIGAQVQRALGFTPQQFPLAKVLEGGTWWAGRFLAQEKREGGNPPLSIQSDGTVF